MGASYSSKVPARLVLRLPVWISWVSAIGVQPPGLGRGRTQSPG